MCQQGIHLHLKRVLTEKQGTRKALVTLHFDLYTHSHPPSQAPSLFTCIGLRIGSVLFVRIIKNFTVVSLLYPTLFLNTIASRKTVFHISQEFPGSVK